MHVLHVLSGLHAAGIESLALQLIRHAPEGVQSELLNVDRSHQAMAPSFGELQTEGHLQALHQWPRCDGPWLAWRTYNLCRRRRPDALLIYPCQRPMLWVALGARLAGVNRLAVHLGNPVPLEPSALHTWHRLLRWFKRLGVVAVPCSQAIVESLQPLPLRLHLGPVIPNGCDTLAIGERAAIARAQRLSSDPRRVLMVARLDKIKDQATLLHAFAAARQPHWQLQLVGDGPERSRLEKLACELGLDPSEVFLGRRADIPDLLGRADLFAFSTTAAEGFGIAMIEALAAALPVIASDVPACREVLMDGAAGELVSPGNVSVWADRLKRMMARADLCADLVERALAHAGHYDITICAESWFELLSA